MPTSIFIAKLLGPIFMLVGLALPPKVQMFRTILQEFIQSAALLYLAGFFGLLGGLALILTHNVWVLDWRLIITLIGWITVVRAMITILQPEWIVMAGTAILRHQSILLSAAVANLIVGMVLSYFGYAA